VLDFHHGLLGFLKGGVVRYTVTTFKVRLEVAELGDRTAASKDVARVARPIFADLDADKEHFIVLALNNKHRVNGYKLVSTGSLTASLVRPAVSIARFCV
jgi:DNA repair protein RadC